MKFQFEPLDDEYGFQEFINDLFNAKFATNSFEEYRSKGLAQFGIDVYSPELRIAVQAKKKKLSRNKLVLTKELVADFDQSIELLKSFPYPVDTFIVASTTPKYSEVQDKAISLSLREQKKIQFLAWEDIEKDLTAYPKLRSKYYPHLQTEIIPRELTIIPKKDLSKIEDRKDDVEKIASLLTLHDVVSIKAVGGTGKTTLLYQLYQKQLPNFEHSVWINYQLDFKREWAFNTALHVSLGLAFPENTSVDVKYETVLMKFNSLKGSKIIYIDNLSHQDDLNLNRELGRLLASSRTKIIFTTRERWNEFHQYQLINLTLEALRNVFIRFCKKGIEAQNELDELIGLVNYNVLLVVLCAKTIQNSPGLTVYKMCKALTDMNISSSILPISFVHDNEIESNRDILYNQIAKVFDMSRLSPWQHTALCILAFCPLGSLPIEEVLEAFNIDSSEHAALVNAFNELDQVGLVERTDDLVLIHPVIQDVYRMDDTVITHFSFFLGGLVYQMNETNLKMSSSGYRLQLYAESALQKLTGERTRFMTQPILVMMNNLFVMYRYLGQEEKKIAIGKKLRNDFERLEETYNHDPILLSTIYHSIAIMFFEEANVEDAVLYFNKSIDKSRDLNNILIVQSYIALMDIYWKSRKWKESLDCCQKAISIIKSNDFDRHGYLMAMFANQTAMIYLELGDYSGAVDCIHAAIFIHNDSQSTAKSKALLAQYRLNASLIYTVTTVNSDKSQEDKAETHKTAVLLFENAIHDRLSLNYNPDHELPKYYRIGAFVYHQAGNEEAAKILREAAESSNVK
ncbi:tetratricopeptide repeat protein [Dyadobacter psychrotolerans]|uniref:Uncharacterized protein n=1 Tax=Dyadobacter psychrotolerans TaxID=2541721 RepID=A0A4R5DKR3_9BACT|nr:hypothetical protein [Dyadobacter psychrotolerans]TDE14776.1 hypothetical protein E0F88_16450 [Dyadobacter psychrotolerans]